MFFLAVAEPRQFDGEIKFDGKGSVSLESAGLSSFHGSYQMGKASLGFEMMKIIDLSSLLEELNRKNTAWNELARKRSGLMDELALLKCQMEAIDPTTPVTF